MTEDASATIRTVRVKMDAEVAAFIANTTAAGESLDRAFGHDKWARINRDMTNFNTRSTRVASNSDAMANSFNRLGQSFGQADQRINRVNTTLGQTHSRIGNIVSAAVLLGPALLPLSTVAVTGVAGLTAGLGTAAAAIGVTTLALHGLGDGLKAIETYNAKPTAENLAALNAEMDKLGPSGAKFVQFIATLEPDLAKLQQSARSGLLPGLGSSIDELLPLLPKVQAFIAQYSDELGALAQKGTTNLIDDPQWHRFFSFVKTEGVPTLDAWAKATGNVATGMATLLTDFAPEIEGFNQGLLDSSKDFSNWAGGLDRNSGSFKSFLDYIHSEGPQARAFFSALVGALGAVVEATAPWGAAVLPVLTTLLQILAALAKSPAGPVLFSTAAGLLAFKSAAKGIDLLLIKAGAAWSGFGASATTAAAETTTAAATVQASTASIAASAARVGLLATAITLGSAHVAQAGYNAVEGKLRPQQDTLGTSDNVNSVVDSLRNGWRSKWESPLSVVGFNPDGIGNKAPVQNADSGLAAMVSSGQSQQAAKDFAVITAAAQKQGIAIDTLNQRFPLYTKALAQTRTATTGYTGSTKTAASASNKLTASIANNIAEMQAQHQQQLASFDATTAYGQALATAAAQAAKGTKGLSAFTAAGRANRTALSGLISAYNSQSNAVKNNVKGYENARSKLIAFGHQMGLTKSQINSLVKELDRPKEFVISGINPSIAQLRAMKAVLDSLHDKTITVTQMHKIIDVHTDPLHGGGVQSSGSAGGSTVPKDGGPYTDRFPYLLAPGEEVISNRHGQADKHRALLKAINAGLLADGGTVTGGNGGGLAKGGSNSTHAADNGPQLKSLKAAEKSLTASINRFTKELDAAKTALQNERDARAQLVSTIQSSLTPDLWQQPTGGSAFSASTAGGSFAGIVAGLKTERSNANELARLETDLKRKGVTGPALTYILSSPDPVAAAKEFDAQTRGQLQGYSRLYNSATGAVQHAANVGGNAVHAGQINTLTKRVASLEKTLKSEEAKSRANAKQIAAQQAAAAKRKGSKTARTKHYTKAS